MEEVVPQVEVGLNQHVGFTQGYEGRDMYDPQRSQMMQFQVIELQQRAEESMQGRTKAALVKRQGRHNVSHRRSGGRRICRNMTCT
jgi:hypothetical protein